MSVAVNRDDEPSADPSVPQAPPANSDLPYLRGRAEFYSVFGDLAQGKRNWQLAAFGAIGVAGVLAIGLVTLTMQSRIVPYIVEVDRLGRAQAFGPADRLRATDQRLIASQLAGFVRDIRSVLTDGPAQAALVRRSYAFVDQNAADFLNAYFTSPANDPRVLARDGSRLVEVVSVLPLPNGSPSASSALATPAMTWKVSWTETTYPRGAGAPATAAAWEGYFATRVVPPSTTERIELNPLGLYVTSINWTRLATRSEDGPTLATTTPVSAFGSAIAESTAHAAASLATDSSKRAPHGAKE